MNSMHHASPELWSSDVTNKEKGGEQYHHLHHQHHLNLIAIQESQGLAGKESITPFADIKRAPEEMNYQKGQALRQQHPKNENRVVVYDSNEDIDFDADKSAEENRMTERSCYRKEDNRMVTNEAFYDSQIISHIHSRYNKEVELDKHMGISYQNHKTVCISVLVDYISQRLSRHDDEDKDPKNDSPSSNHEEDIQTNQNKEEIGNEDLQVFHTSESNTGSEILEPESQPIHENDIVSKDPNTRIQQRQSQQQQAKDIEEPNHIPPIRKALHAVHLVSQVDLYTNTLCLELCRVETIIPLRRTNRRSEMTIDLQTPSNVGNNDNHLHPPKQLSLSHLPNFQYGRHADDGPLFGIYNQVLSMDILQLDTPTQQKFHQATSTLYPTAKLYRRMSIYFYNDYASRIHKFLQIHPNCNYYCCLMEIPAICIFPYRTQPCGWFDEDLSDYVVCIGGQSQCCVTEGTGQLHFEHQDMKIVLLAVSLPVHPNSAPSFTEYTLGPSAMTESSSTKLREALQNWKVHHGILPDPAAKVETIMDEAPQDEPPAKRPRKMRYTELLQLPQILSSHNRNHRFLFHGNHARSSSSLQYPSVDVIGVILGFNTPFRTKTHNWTVSCRIIDPSISTASPQQLQESESHDEVHAISINVFRKHEKELPRFIRAGDLIRLLGAGLQEYRGKMQLLVRHTTQIDILTRKLTPEVSYHTEDGTSFSSDEVVWMESLWKWGQERISTKTTMMHSLRCTLSDLFSKEEPGDCTAMVCGYYEVPPLTGVHLPKGYLRVWDGTGLSISDPLPQITQLSMAMIKSGDPPQKAIISLYFTVMNLNKDSFGYDTERLNEIRCVCGQVVNLAIWETPHWEYITSHIKVGNFIRLQNVQKEVPNNNKIGLAAHAKTWLFLLPDTALEVRDLLRNHQRRLESIEDYNPNSGLLPLTVSSTHAIDYAYIENSDISTMVTETPKSNRVSFISVLEAREDNESCFQGKFRIKEILPDCKGRLQSLCRNIQGQLLYQFVINIEDDSGAMVNVLVLRKVGNSLFGMVAEELCKEGVEQGSQWLDDICKVNVWWNGVIETQILDGEQFFVLKSIQKCSMVA